MANIMYKGKSYPSVKELCMELDVNLQKVYILIQKGITLEDAIGKSKNSERIALEYQGVIYPTYIELINATGSKVSPQTFSARLRRGFSIEDALSGERAPRRGLRINFMGEEYPNLKSLCYAEKVSYTGVRELMKVGYSLFDAVHLLLRK